MLGTEEDRTLDPDAQSALQAVEDGDADGLESVLERDPSVVHATVRDNCTLLEIATDQSDLPIATRSRMMRALIARGASMTRALWTSDRRARDLLIDAGALRDGEGPAFLSMKSDMLHGRAAAADDWLARGIEPVGLWMAAGGGDIERVRSFFDDEGHLLPEAAAHRPNLADIGWLEQVSRSDDPLEILDEAFVLACFNNRAEVAEFLLDRGARVNAKPPGFGGAMTGLHMAAMSGGMECVRLLVARGADVNLRSDGQITAPAVNFAYFHGHDRVGDYLLQHGAKPLSIGDAVFFGKRQRVEELLATDPALANVEKAKLLRTATERGHAAVIKCLLEHGADPSLEDTDGRTALSIAADRGDREMIQLLQSHD